MSHHKMSQHKMCILYSYLVYILYGPQLAPPTTTRKHELPQHTMSQHEMSNHKGLFKRILDAAKCNNTRCNIATRNALTPQPVVPHTCNLHMCGENNIVHGTGKGHTWIFPTSLRGGSMCVCVDREIRQKQKRLYTHHFTHVEL